MGLGSTRTGGIGEDVAGSGTGWNGGAQTVFALGREPVGCSLPRSDYAEGRQEGRAYSPVQLSTHPDKSQHLKCYHH
jgi:hypothetical protein